MRTDVWQQLADYRGVLGWNAFTNASSVAVPAIEIPLFIKQYGVPIRKPKITEINTAAQSRNGYRLATNIAFEGAPDPLQTELQGWVITPQDPVTGYWSPKDINGNSLNIGNVSYVDIITAFIEGRMNPNPTGVRNPKDPDYFTAPYGQRYLNPYIAQWQPTQAQPGKKQAFTMVLFLEQ